MSSSEDVFADAQSDVSMEEVDPRWDMRPLLSGLSSGT